MIQIYNSSRIFGLFARYKVRGGVLHSQSVRQVGIPRKTNHDNTRWFSISNWKVEYHQVSQDNNRPPPRLGGKKRKNNQRLSACLSLLFHCRGEIKIWCDTHSPINDDPVPRFRHRRDPKIKRAKTQPNISLRDNIQHGWQSETEQKYLLFSKFVTSET